MRKSLFLTSLLLIVSIGTIYGTNHWLNTLKDAIEIEEITLLGDKSAAKGITVKSRTNSIRHLFWETQFIVEDPLDPKTTFIFSQAAKEEPRVRVPQLMISSSIDFSMGGNGLDLEQEHELATKPAIDVATRTPNGEKRTEIVSLSDYYPFYPVTMDVELPYDSNFISYAPHVVTNYFKIPISKQHKLEVSVTKNTSGEIVDVESNTISDNKSLQSEAVILKSGCYYIICFSDAPIENSLEIPIQVSGIHFLPFEIKDGFPEANLTKMKCVYPFEDKSTKALSLTYDETDETLLLITREDNAVMLSVIDRHSMTLIQKTEITKTDSNVSFSEIKQLDNAFVISFSDQRFYLFSKTTGRQYDLMMADALPDLEQIGHVFFDRTQMAYNGNRLVMTFYPQYYESSLCLIVYDQTGLAYVGQYAQSTDRSVKSSIHQNVRPMDQSPLSILFESSF
ncbi:hypothetical protein [Fusibacter ferrireducens]|uniref:Uncharacterized protein n=1 Tax=Fusibacter ferrireducens TaxID=2785058 RepID=A0ABR9ZZ69_9FIRM|nr:hypothetical protein [Fusibacter ferrireducens]MBF4695753.1 hypothetical protein [Fusibacter ferrireducens]